MKRSQYYKRYTAFHKSSKYTKRWSTEFDKDTLKELFNSTEDVFTKNKLNKGKILEIGCAGGNSLFKMRGNDLSVGIDIREERLGSARRNFPALFFCCSNSSPLPFKNDSFDTVFQFVTFSSILDQNIKMVIGKEIKRVLKKEGIFLWYDYRYPNPLNPFTTYEPKRKINKYFPDIKFNIKTMTVIPQIGRVLYANAPHTLAILNKISLFHSHYFGWFIKK